jgi:putative nucleotidyltransferase with HDIG domain
MLQFLTSLNNKFIIRSLIYLGSALAIFFLSLFIFTPYIPYSVEWEIGSIAPRTIFSPKFIQFQSVEDFAKTEELRQKRLALLEPIYNVNENINKSIKSNIINFFTQAKKYKQDRNRTGTKNIPNEFAFLKIAELNTLLNRNINYIEYLTLQNTEEILSRGISTIDVKVIIGIINDNSKILMLEKKQQELISDIIINYLKPNLIIDQQKTDILVQKELASIDPFYTTYKEGQPIIYKGEKVTSAHIETLKQLNLYAVNINLIKLFGNFILTCFLLYIIERFVFHFIYRVHNSYKHFILMYLMIFLLVSIARLLQLTISFQKVGEPQYLIPISLLALVISFLITPNLAMIIGTITAMFICIMYKMDFSLFIYLFFSICVATFSVYKKYKRSDMIKSGYIVGFFNAAIIIAIGLFKELHDPLWFGINSLFGFSSGIISSMIAFALLPYLESLFRITTSLNLLEHTNLNHPLLKRLMISAPGTYQHSIMVANLSEAAAEAIMADPILARTGAYFHDIGKVKRPIFYSENQFGTENPHNNLNPRMSKLIIQAHIKDGLALANRYKLPKVLKDFILQHHGTSLVSFFFTQAVQTEGIKDTESAKEEFRYPGPKPQLKEIGIVMLADAAEAAVRGLEKPAPGKIENMLDKIFREKIDDNQLDECPLDLKELEIIRKTFLEVFKGIYHSRLDYEEELENILDQQKQKNNS